MRLELPWPPKGLSPNDRLHWAKKAKVYKKYKDDCTLLAFISDEFHLNTTGSPIKLRITFHPPSKAHRDLDNMVASIKALMDGIALASRVNDYWFEPTYIRGDVVRGGLVVVELT